MSCAARSMLRSCVLPALCITRQCMQAECLVDGRSTDLWHILDLHHSTCAWTGFYLGNLRDQHRERPFIFQEPARFHAPGVSAAAADAGIVKVEFSILGPVVGHHHRHADSAVGSAPAVPKLEGAAAVLLHVLSTCCVRHCVETVMA